MVIPQSSHLTEIPTTDAILKSRADQLAREMATQVTTLDDLNGLMRAMMKTALERMLNTEMDVHLGRRAEPTTDGTPTPDAPTTNASGNAPAALKNRRNGHSRKTRWRSSRRSGV